MWVTNESSFYVKTMWFPFSISVVYAPPILFKSNATKSNLDLKYFGYDIITLLPTTEYTKDKRVRTYFCKPFSFSQIMNGENSIERKKVQKVHEHTH